ncbi:ATP-binding protein [uncultured Desulfobacter sp.]|uniref:sensor histidine kinase n=1 Tax=uncultured Desulfobacter sp. TaxID=240139 RepID=UPI0029F4A9E5|nr:ATP-binding protein [uncultured Desulfobacter sp.]
MLRVKTKYRLLSSLHMLIPVMVIIFCARNTDFFFDTAFQTALTICICLILFNARFSPFLFGLQWLCFKQIQQIAALCLDIKHGNYRYFDIPNEPLEQEDENELIFLMRSMNWMVRQIELREVMLEKQVAKRTRDLETTNGELRIARDAAKASSNAKSQFLANMSHEIRTPMNAIIGISDFMRKADLPPQMNEYASIINTSSKDLLKIINDVLDFSKIDAGKIGIERVPVNLQNLVEEVIDIFKPDLAQKSVELITDIHENVPSQMETDPLRLKQVMTNLVSNAVKFTQQGEILIRITARDRENNDGFYLEVSIHDTGIGMDHQALDHLFQAFTQADGATARKFGGTGLGLAISKNLIELMGGQIFVSSTKGKGSCFSFSILTQRLMTNHLPAAGQHALQNGKTYKPKQLDLNTGTAEMGRQFHRTCEMAPPVNKQIDESSGDTGPDPEQKLCDQVIDMITTMGTLLNKNSLDAKLHAAALTKKLSGTIFAENADTLSLQIKHFDFPNARKTFQSLEAEIRNHLS